MINTHLREAFDALRGIEPEAEPAAEPTHIHVPRPSRTRQVPDTDRTDEKPALAQLALDEAA